MALSKTRRIPVKPEFVQMWQDRIRDAEGRTEKYLLPKWRATLREYEGGSEGEENGLHFETDQEVRFNFLLGTANSIIPSILSEDNYIRCRPRREEDKGIARTTEAALNFIWREIDGGSTLRDLALDALLFQVAWGKIGYEASGAMWMDDDYETGPTVIAEESPQDTDVDEAIAALGMDIATDPQDYPSLNRVQPWNMYLPPGVSDPRKAAWIAERLTMALSDLKADKRFVVPAGLEPDTYLVDGAPASLASRMETTNQIPATPPEHVTVYEIRYWHRAKDRLQRRILWLLRGSDAGQARVEDLAIRHIDDPLEMRGYPYRMMRFTSAPGRLVAPELADLSCIRDVSRRLNDEWGNILRHHAAASKQKYAVPMGALSGDSKLAELLETDSDLAVAEVGGNADVRQSIFLLPVAPTPPDYAFVVQGLQRLMYEIGGVDVYQRGGVGRKGTTATEVAVASGAFESRAGIRRAAIFRFVREVARAMLEIVRQFWDTPRYIRVAGDDGEDTFLSFSSESLRGMYDLDIEVIAGTPKDPMTEQAAFLGLLQTLQQTVAALLPLVQGGMLPPETIPNFLERAFSVWNQDRAALVGPFAALQSGVTAQSPSAPTMPMSPDDVPDRGMGPDGGALAGTGPRPRPGAPAFPGAMGGMVA